MFQTDLFQTDLFQLVPNRLVPTCYEQTCSGHARVPGVRAVGIMIHPPVDERARRARDTMLRTVSTAMAGRAER